MTTTSGTARRRRLAFAAFATIAATIWAAVQDDGSGTPDIAATSPPQHRPEPVPNTGVQAWPGPPDISSRPAWRDALPQGLAAWGPATPPAAPVPVRQAADPAASDPSQPPEFPYTLIGRLDDGQAWAMLSNRTRSFGAKASDVIDEVWRVDVVDASGVTLTWLPGRITRTLAFPNS